jgi:hypothetical protein
MERLKMKWWMLAVAVAVVDAEARQYYICNEASDSFSVNINVKNPKVVITPLITNTDSSTIVGRRDQPCGKGSIRREKRYDVVFHDGYIPLPGEEPFISFKNDKGEFKLVFFDENYAELCSDVASEIHDDPQRREYDHLYTQSDLRTESYDGYVRHWMVFGKYMTVLGYENYRFAQRAIYICDALADNSWIKTVKEVYECCQIGLFLPPLSPRPKHSWLSKLCSCSDCDD